jgi:tRNA isopentenyl-2-thiomethyl-A-37 hydroxylase MiaE
MKLMHHYPSEKFIISTVTTNRMVWLIGISHEEKYLEQVLDRLAHEDLANKKVMVEMFAYPMPKAIKKRYPSHANFWDRLASYIQSRNGTLIFGDDKKLYYEAKQKTKEFMKNLPRKRITELARQYGNIAYVKRNPHFAKAHTISC